MPEKGQLKNAGQRRRGPSGISVTNKTARKASQNHGGPLKAPLKPFLHHNNKLFGESTRGASIGPPLCREASTTR